MRWRDLLYVVLPTLGLLTSAARSQNFFFCIDPTDGRFIIDSGVPFAGFTLQSTTGALLPENLPWLGGTPASGAILLDPDNFVILSALSASTSDISVGTTGSPAPPGTYDLGQIIDLSLLNLNDPDNLGVACLSNDNTLRPAFPILSTCIPEPTSSLLACGVLGIALRRRTC
ncbi:MAG: hypothetical protein AAF561_10500 [Planctomycetota bacterium]